MTTTSTAPAGGVNPKAQRNFTDPDSRIMNIGSGYERCFNAQAAVDAGTQVIVARGLTNSASDQGQLVPLLDDVHEHLGTRPAEVSADADHCSESNLQALDDRGVRGYVATARRRHDGTWSEPGPGPRRGERVARMRRRLRQGGIRSRYRLRKQTVEPVFGQIKAARGFRQFLLRGLENVSHEWSMVCTAHNLLKLLAHRQSLALQAR